MCKYSTGNSFIAIVLISLLSFNGLLAQQCPSDFSGRKQKGLRSTKLNKSFFYADFFITPHIQYLRILEPKYVTDMAYGGDIGIRFPSRFAIDFGAVYYNTDRELNDYGTINYVNGHFIELNTQFKYYFDRAKNISWYPMITLTANLGKLNEPLNEFDVINDNKIFYHFFYMSLGAGIEKGVSKVVTLYAEPAIRIPSEPGWSYITYYSSLRLSLGIRFKM